MTPEERWPIGDSVFFDAAYIEGAWQKAMERRNSPDCVYDDGGVIACEVGLLVDDAIVVLIATEADPDWVTKVMAPFGILVSRFQMPKDDEEVASLRVAMVNAGLAIRPTQIEMAENH